MWFDGLLFIVGVAAGGVASIAGFGIGSFLTPILALKTGFGPAIAVVSVAHMVGSLLRYWLLRLSINKKVLLQFGLVSALGGSVGAFLHAYIGSGELAIVFGALMVLAGLLYTFHISDKANLGGVFSWMLGLLSGVFGGLVGNQGGMRAAAMTGFRLKKMEFVATATAIALIVDLFRVPIYIATNTQAFVNCIDEMEWMIAGVVMGTLVGAPILRKISDRYFTILLSAILIVVGILLMMQL